VEALSECVTLCALPSSFASATATLDPSAIDLLLGIDEDVAGSLESQMKDVVVIKTKNPDAHKITSSLRRLLTINAKDHAVVYVHRRDRLKTVLTGATDYLSATPLEASYAWTLSCRSARFGFLKFTEQAPEFKIQCARLKDGRFFTGSDLETYDATPENLKEDEIYYVDEPPGTEKHPRADIFFRTNNEVVLIDIGGSLREDEISEKSSMLRKWILQTQPSESAVTFHGVVLAPFVDGASTSDRFIKHRKSTMTVVCGEDAPSLLGGLRQLARWLET